MLFNFFMAFPLRLQKIPLRHKTMELFVPEPEAVRKEYHRGNVPFPYWTQVWPAAIALSEFLLQHPIYVKGKKLLELAGGLGLPSLVAAPYAAKVLCSDFIPETIEVISRSAAHNGLDNFKTALLNWHFLPADVEADVLLLSDVSYEPGDFDGLHHLINRFLQNGTTVILSTPQRLMAKEFISPLLPMAKRKEEIIVHQEEKEIPITVLVLQK